MITKLIAYYFSLGSLDSDSEELKLKRSLLILIPLIVGIAAFIWGLIYLYLEHYLSAAIPLSYTIISVFTLWHYHKTKDIKILQNVQMLLVLFLPFFLMWSLGGFSSSSFVFIWAFYAPIASLTYEEKRKSLYWFYAFIVLVLLSTLMDASLASEHVGCLPPFAIELFYFLNITAGLAGIFFLIKYFIEEKEKNSNQRLEKEHKALLVSTEKLEELNAELEHLAQHDTLTGLANRYQLRKNMKKMLSLATRNSHSVSMLFLDLDGFKNINDKYGHAIGDKILVEVATRLCLLLREEDTVARLGGDEFAVVIGHSENSAYVIGICERIIEAICMPYVGLEESILSVSIGVSSYPNDAQDIDMLINNADEAMYRVKKNGKNSYEFYA